MRERSKLADAGRLAGPSKVKRTMHSARVVRSGLVLLVLPFAFLACDRFKKGEPDAGVSAAPSTPVATATVVETAPAVDPGTTPPVVAPGTPVQPSFVARVDGGAKDAGVLSLDAGALKLDAGALKLDAGPAPIPTPIPTPTPKGVPSAPPGFPTTLPTVLPTVLPTTIPSLPWPPKK